MKAFKFKNLHSRRVFLSRLVKTGIVLSLPVFDSCKPDIVTPSISDRNNQILKDVLAFLWPDDGNGPSAEEAKIYEYFLWMFSDTNVDPEEKEYLFKGMGWTEETAMEEQNKHFEELDKGQRNLLFDKIATTDWGESWLSKVINIIIEAILSDPIYGSNPDGIGYKWLDHNPGFPRPEQGNKYQELMKRKEENVIITNLDQLR